MYYSSILEHSTNKVINFKLLLLHKRAHSVLRTPENVWIRRIPRNEFIRNFATLISAECLRLITHMHSKMVIKCTSTCSFEVKIGLSRFICFRVNTRAYMLQFEKSFR